VYIWFLKTGAIPAGTYVSQIRATPYLQQGKVMDNSILQKWLLAVLKRMLGVRDTTPSSWYVIRECGFLEPLLSCQASSIVCLIPIVTLCGG